MDNNITTIVDLRSDKEVAENPCILKELDGFGYFHLPVSGGGDTPKSLEHLHTVYRQMLDEKMEKIIDTIINAQSNVMYFCTAGKDRTGVVSAIILKQLGFSDEIIIEVQGEFDGYAYEIRGYSPGFRHRNNYSAQGKH